MTFPVAPDESATICYVIDVPDLPMSMEDVTWSSADTIRMQGVCLNQLRDFCKVGQKLPAGTSRQN